MSHADAAAGGLPTLLIADDDPVIRSVLAAQLSGSFRVVDGTADADATIAAAAEHQPDLAIIDVQMPAGGGLRATQELQHCSPGTAIVAYSGDESDMTVREMIGAGAVAYVRKGVAAPELATTLQRSLQAHLQLRSA